MLTMTPSYGPSKLVISFDHLAMGKYLRPLTKVVNTVSIPIPVWLLEWNISIPINTGVSFRIYRYIYIHELHSLLKVHIF